MAKQVRTDLDFGGVSKVTNLPSPSASGDATSKSYVDSLVEGLKWKNSARVATQGNVNLASPGASIDGISLSAGDRVLVKSQTAAAENGIYIWNGAAVVMTRATDANTGSELEQAVVSIEEGTDAGTSWRQSNVNFTIDVGAVNWGSFGASVPSATETTSGVAEIATQAETDAGTDDARIVTPLKLATSVWAKKKTGTLIGDGSATSYTVTHNLGTRDVLVSIYLNSGTYEEVFCDVEHTTINSVTLKFSSAPTSNQYRVVVIG